ncbi:MFS transporter [Clostridium tyrobutyricum]|uniref:MFS transporter n=1 Tax=Clostridium tyrobutyricum TaxID=1519 RepID=UPI00189E42A3|nr:MFS transporter [Clostridium tyrobutyricum]MBV4439092.1 MFS transporter [Clostridium tyrobutyricum]MBV4448487.1 MFS transporter [Clostridium tyrobutyricum]
MIEKKQKKIALIVAMCLFMEMLDGTIVTTATPAISNTFKVPLASTSVIITAYMITLAMFIPLSGWFADRFNNKTIFLSAIVIFTGASIGCALSKSFDFLVAMRIIQGLGGSMMVPVGRLIVLKKTHKKELLQMISYLVWPGLIAPAIAPLLGGLIVTYYSWHLIFAINIPLGAIAFLVSFRILENSNGDKNKSLDWMGFILIGIGAGGIIYAANILADSSRSWEKGLVLLLIFIMEFLLAMLYLYRTKDPLIDLRVLKIKTFRISQTGGSLFWFCVGAAPFLLTIMLQNLFGWSAAYSGSIVLFIFVGNIGIKPASTFLINKYGFKTIFIDSMLVVSITMVVSAFFSIHTPIVFMIIITILSGIGRSLTFTSYNSIAYSELDYKQTNATNTLESTTKNMAQALGIAIISVVLRIGQSIFSGKGLESLSYRLSFFVLAVFCIMALIEIFTLPKNAGNVVLKDR